MLLKEQNNTWFTAHNDYSGLYKMAILKPIKVMKRFTQDDECILYVATIWTYIMYLINKGVISYFIGKNNLISMIRIITIHFATKQ